MLICLSPLAILLKITFIIHKEQKPASLPLVRAGAGEGRRGRADPARCTEPVPGDCRHSSAAFSAGSANHAPCLAQAPGSSARPCQSPAQQEEASSGQQMLLTLTPVTNRKDKKSLEEAATCFLCQELGAGAGGREQDGTSQHCCSFKAVFVGMPLLDYYCYQKGK